MSRIIFLEPSADLSDCWFNKAMDQYFNAYQEMPKGIITSPDFDSDVTFLDLKVVLLSNFPSDAWMLFGEKGILYSDGA